MIETEAYGGTKKGFSRTYERWLYVAAIIAITGIISTFALDRARHYILNGHKQAKSEASFERIRVSEGLNDLLRDSEQNRQR